MSFSLNNQVIVVTGGTGILGHSFVNSIADAGATVVILGRNEQIARERAALIQKKGGNALAVICDVLDQTQLQNAREEILGAFGRIDGLVNAAGGNMAGAVVQPEDDLFKLDIAALQQVMNLNLMGTLLPVQVFGEAIINTAGKGSIVNISSATAHRAVTKVLGYSMAKAAVESYTKWFAVELARRYGDALRMNVLIPGFFLTEQNRNLLTHADGSYTARGHDVIRQTPFSRFGQAPELSGALIWLLSRASGFTTGTAVTVDGGFSCFSGV